VFSSGAWPRFEQLGGEIQLFVLSDFNEDIRHLIHLLKYRGKTKVGIWLGEMIGHQLNKYFAPDSEWIIVPIPLHAARKRERGYNQSALIATSMGKVLHLYVHEHLVKRLRNTPTQTQLHLIERQENVWNAFRVVQPDLVTGKKILLLDDVVTTGATVMSCAQMLLQIGATEVVGVAIGRPQLGQDGV
jgi:ComF family protein